MADQRTQLALRAPRWLLCVLAAGSTAYFFWFYGDARVWVTDGEFGFSARRAGGALLVAVLSIPVALTATKEGLTVVALAGLAAAAAWFQWWRDQRVRAVQATAGSRRCEACGYPAAGLREEVCPECGGQHFQTVPPRRTLVWRPLLLAVCLGCAFGVGAAEVWLSVDEAAFRREVLAGGGADRSRPRAWPFAEGILHHRSGVYSSQGD